MVEQGLVLLIQAGLNSSVPGGFPLILPKDLINASIPSAWCYKSILSTPLQVFEGVDPMTKWEVQIDCHGFTMVSAILLARKIDSVLQSFKGTMFDYDSTVVVGMFRLPGQVDGYVDASRTFVRSIEYEIHYYANTPASTFNFYIDPVGGNDARDGSSISNAWLTTTPADAQSLLTGETIGYLLDGTWFLYRELGMTAKQLALAAYLVTAGAS